MSYQGLHVTVLAGAEILARLTPEVWRRLALRLDDSPYFLQYEALAGYLTHLRGVHPTHGDALALLLERGGELQGILVLERESVTVSGLKLPSLTLVSHPHAPQSDALLAKGERLEAYWPAIVEALSERGVRWEMIRSPGSRTSSAMWHGTRGALMSRTISTPVGWADYFDCTGTHEALVARYGTSLRRRIGQAQRQLARMGRVEYSCVKAGEPGMQQAFQQFLDLECAGWKGQQRTAIAQSAALVAHYEQFCRLSTTEAWSEVHLMTLDDKVIAAQFCVVSGGIREVVKLAYDETLRKQSPGNVMLDHMLAFTCADPAVAHFGLVGRPDWLAEWSPSSHEVHDVWVFRRRAVAQLAVLSSRIKKSAVAFLQQRVRGEPAAVAPDARVAAPVGTPASSAPASGGGTPPVKPSSNAGPQAATHSAVPSARVARGARTERVRDAANPSAQRPRRTEYSARGRSVVN